MNQSCLEVAPTIASSASELPLTVKKAAKFLGVESANGISLG